MNDDVAQEPRSGGSTGVVLSFLSLLLIALVLGYFALGTIIPPGTIGVRQIKFGPYQGFSSRGLEPGYHWNIPFYSQIHLVPRTIQLLHFDRATEATKAPNFGALEILSSDRATVDVDVTVLYRMFDSSGVTAGEKHGGPAELLTLGTTPASWENEVKRRVEDQLKRNLGQLQTASFYDPASRESRLADAEQAANAAVAPLGIKIEAILLRRFTYQEDRIDNAIFRKNLQEQEEQKNLAMSRFVEVEGLVRKIEAERSAANLTLEVEGQKIADVIRSKGDLYEAQQRAQGDLLVAKARAEVDRLKADALAKSPGAAAYVGSELAPLLSSLKGGVVSDVDPYDLDGWLKRLGVEKK